MNPTALIVDDEVLIQEMICEELSFQGWKVQGANSGIQALEALGAGAFDIIVSDVRMPDMDGLELLRAVRRRNDSLIFALMTGYTEISAWDCFALGANEVFGKPFRFQDVQALLERLSLPMSERWGEAGKLCIPGKIRSHLDVKRRSAASGFAIGLNGFCIDTADISNITRGDIVSFHVQLPVMVLDGVGKVRWKKKTGAGVSIELGIEFLFLEEASRHMVIKMIEECGVKTFIPSL